MYAFSFVLANFGIAIAARMPMITTTISSSISVKPLVLRMPSPLGVTLGYERCRGDQSQGMCRVRAKPMERVGGGRDAGRGLRFRREAGAAGPPQIAWPFAG